MGGDGGSIPTRRCLVPKKRKKIIKDQRFKNTGKYAYCQLSNTKLKKPILCSRLGKLYNKDCVIEFLLDKNKAKDEESKIKLDGLTSLKKDFTEVNITDNSEFIEKMTPGQNFTNGFPFICPVTRLDLNGINQVVFSKETKNVVTLKALRDANLDVLPKSILNYELTNDTTEENEERLHPIFEDVHENRLIDPVSSQPFGRVFQLYPESRAEIRRAFVYNPKKEKKKKEKEKELQVDEKAALEGENEAKPVKKGVKFASFVENNEGGFTNMGQPIIKETPGLAKLKSLKSLKGSSNSSSSTTIDLSKPKTVKQKPKAVQKYTTSTIKTKAIRILAEDISDMASNSSQISKYRKLNLIGDTSRIVDTDDNALKHMMGIQRSYHL